MNDGDLLTDNFVVSPDTSSTLTESRSSITHMQAKCELLLAVDITARDTFTLLATRAATVVFMMANNIKQF